ncbi:MAG TPA: SpoIID/LytB domain-containing protein [Phycisphaerae bacterium]|nr:SpoIID/LytB domain-containing protein [Phycisphaerae bacterium]
MRITDADTGRLLGEAFGDLGPAVFERTGIRFPEAEVVLPASGIDLASVDGRPLGLVIGARARWFPGRLRLAYRYGRVGSVGNLLDIEDYLPAVVAAELDTRFHPETFRAQAIIARTFAWYQMRTVGRKRPHDVTASEGSQMYLHLQRVEEVPEALCAVRDTTGLVCTWHSPAGDRIFCTYYSSACGGWTASSLALSPMRPVPPLAGDVLCPSCRYEQPFPWGPVVVPKADLAARLAARDRRFKALEAIDRLEIHRMTGSGRPLAVTAVDISGREAELDAENFRLALDPTGREIRSAFACMEDAGEAIVIRDGRGFGHGVGLCQHGAEWLARRGADAATILRHYYPGSKLRRAY